MLPATFLKSSLTWNGLKPFTLNALLCLCYLPVSASFTIVIQGKVLDERRAPVSSALVQLYLGATPLEEFPHTVSVDGKFSIKVPGARPSHVTLKITAPYFQQITKTIVIDDADIAVGDILLIRLPTVKLGPMILNESPSRDKSLFDIDVSNVSKERLLFKKVVVSGVRRAHTQCLDVTSKVITIEIKDRVNAKSALIKANNESDSVHISGELAILPCEQMELQYAITYGFSIEPGEHLKIRVILPRHVWQNKVKHTVDILQWHKKVIALTLDNGEVIMAKP